MKNIISEIKGNIPNTERQLLIITNEKNIIITGVNGCGKTAFLKELFETIENETIPDKIKRKNQLTQGIKTYTAALKRSQITEIESHEFKENLENHRSKLKTEFESRPIKITFKNQEEILEKATKKEFLTSFFEATRQYTNKKNNNYNQNSLSEIIKTGKDQKLNQDFSTSFESYLVAFFEAGYLAATIRKDEKEKNKVDNWITNITDDLKFLFEDSSLKLVYNEYERCFYINQKDKKPYTFSNLSSGYSSILRIYTDLLMKVELHQISPKELTGIVVIDEIDAHLHVSLQKKILSFLDKAYPNIQFIVSTHSPFVIQSVSNSTIYDLGRLEQLEDLSLYSYEAIVKGLLGVDTNSSSLNKKINELYDLTYNIDKNIPRAKLLIDELSEIEKELDSKSKVILLMAKQAIEDSGEK